MFFLKETEYGLKLEHLSVKSLYILVPIIVLLVGGLYWISLVNYLFYHTLIELAGIIIAFTIFVIVWSTRKYSRNNMVIILAAGYLAVGLIDLLHTLAFSGMGIFPQFDSNAPTQFWIVARYVEAAAFILAAFHLGNKILIRPRFWLYGFLGVSALLSFAVFTGYFPDSFVEGEGLTTFKIASEYIISAVFVASGIVFWRKRNYLGNYLLNLLLLAGTFTVLSELSFTLYIDVYGFFNYLGHIFKLFSIAFIYMGLIHESLTNPFRFLFKEVSDINEKLAESEEKFRNIVEQSSDWVWEVDREGKFTYSNPQVYKLTGYSPDEIVGRMFNDFMEPDGARNNSLYFSEISDRQLPYLQHESAVQHREGHSLIFETNGVPVFDGQEELIGYRGISRDITERKKAEAKIEQARYEAEQANRAKSNFLANMSHEILTPMNVIMGTSEILNNSRLNPVQKEWSEMISESADSLLSIINDLLDYSALEVGRLALTRVRFDLHREVEQAVSSYVPVAREKGLNLTYSIDHDIPEFVMGDPERLRQVLVNLVDNAIKFTDQGGVTVSLQPADDEANTAWNGSENSHRHSVYPVFFSIRDQGIGIPPDRVGSLFQSFSKTDDSNMNKYEGTGLGLALSKSLVELMGGSIGVESTENRGSTFYFTIPFVLPQDSAAITNGLSSGGKEAAPEMQSAEEEKRGLEILLVEDKIMNRKLATHILEKKGHRVSTAKNGIEALEMHKAYHFDLILMDIHMPEMDGLEATTIIRAEEEEKGGHIPIIAMTAYAGQEDQDRSLQAGVNYYITKPISANKLYNALDVVLGKEEVKSLQQELPTGGLQGMIQRFEGNIELLEELLEIFFQDYPKDMVELKDSMEKKDARAVAFTAHGLKGELGNLGMETAYNMARELEKLAKDNNLEEATLLPGLLENEIKRMEHIFTGYDWKEHS